MKIKFSQSTSPISSGNIHGLGAIIFGLIFIAVTIGLFFLTGFSEWSYEDFFDKEKLGQTMPRASVPNWALLPIVSIFGLAGSLVVKLGWDDYLRIQRKKHLHQRYPNQPWKSDHTWTDRKLPNKEKKTSLFQHFVGLSIIAIFHMIPVAIGKGGGKIPYLIYIGLGFFDLIMFSALFIRYRRKNAHRDLSVELNHFPAKLGEKIEGKIKFKKTRTFEELNIKIGCYQESYVRVRTGKRRRTRVDVRELFTETINFSPSEARSLIIPFQVELPDHQYLSSEVGERPARFWEIRLYGIIDGPDLEETFLLPVY